jgi:hypothetical protein
MDRRLMYESPFTDLDPLGSPVCSATLKSTSLCGSSARFRVERRLDDLG